MAAKLHIAVAAHKPYWLPDDPAYLPLHVGAAGRSSLDACGTFTRDDTGENISSRNPNWCELTGVYWLWKNDTSALTGLVHYRRHFKGSGPRGVATGAELAAQLETCDVILPKKRNYLIETTWSQYAHAHHAVDLETTRQIVSERCPGYLGSFDRVMRARSGHRFNMFVMRRAVFDAYCAWLFDILFELEKRLDISAYSPYDARVFGFVSERLLDVWLGCQNLRLAERPVVHLEGQNWPVKIARFLKRKFWPSHARAS